MSPKTIKWIGVLLVHVLAIAFSPLQAQKKQPKKQEEIKHIIYDALSNEFTGLNDTKRKYGDNLSVMVININNLKYRFEIKFNSIVYSYPVEFNVSSLVKKSK